MFVKMHRVKSGGVEHRYASLAETSRTEKGPRQRSIYYLQELNASPSPRRVRKVEVLDLSGRIREVCLVSDDLALPKTADTVRIRMSGISVLRVRQFGNCYLGWHLWRSLRLDDVFPVDISLEAAETPWSRVIGLLAVYRLCVPASRWVPDPGAYSEVGVPELLNVPLARLDDKRVNRCLQLLAAYTPRLKAHLKQNCEASVLEEGSVLLYRFLRSGPRQAPIIVALTLAASGTPVSYAVFPLAEDSAVEFDRVLDRVAERYRKARSICFFAKGELRAEEMLSLSRRSIGSVLVVCRSVLHNQGEQLMEKDWDTAGAGLDWKFQCDQDQTVYAMGRLRIGSREDAAARRGIVQFERRLAELDRKIASNPRLDVREAERALGRILAAHSELSELYHVALEESAGRPSLVWYPKEFQHRWDELLQEYRVFRMNIGTDEPEAVRERLRQLHRLERAFCSIGSELSLVPRDCQDDHTQPTLTLALLSYVLFEALSQSLRAKGIEENPETVLKKLSDLRLVDIALPTTEGRQVVLRRLTRLSDEQARLLAALGLTPPLVAGGFYDERNGAFRAHASGGGT